MLAMGRCLSTSRILAWLGVTVLAGSLLSVPSLAQNPGASASGKLESVKVTGSARYRSEQIVPATGLTPGETITKFDFQNGADRLAQLGIFASVQYRFASEDAGVLVEYQVTDAPGLPVWFDNFPWFPDDELTAALKRAVPLFDGTAPERGSLLHEMSNALELLLATRGVHSSVSNSAVNAPVTDERVQQFHVENAGLNISSVEFSDALAQADRGIHQRLSDVVGQPYSRTLVELFEFEQVRPVYLSHAFLRVRFGAPSARITGGAGDARVAVVAPIEPGPAFAWGGVTWSGNTVVSSAELNGLIALKTGDAADGMKTEAMWDAVRETYTHRGYLDVNLTAAPHFDDNAKRVIYFAAVTEGPQYHMGRLVLTGLSIEGERRLRAAWAIAEGAVFDNSIYEQFVATGIKQAFSGLPFHYEKVERFVQKDAKTGTVDVLLDFE
jgi:outer membrane protein assembly factor BamA